MGQNTNESKTTVTKVATATRIARFQVGEQQRNRPPENEASRLGLDIPFHKGSRTLVQFFYVFDTVTDAVCVGNVNDLG